MLLHRILAVNIFALAVLAGSLFYLDGFRGRLTESAILNAETQAQTIADAMRVAELQEQPWLIRRLGLDTRTRLRVYRNNGGLWMDSWKGARPTYELRDPAREPFRKDIARLLDNAFDAIVGAPASPDLVLPAKDELAAWPEAGESLRAQCCCSPATRATSAPSSVTSG
jgi:two-component system sensor histidine kinase ChvG